MSYRFDLGQQVKIAATGEMARVIARTDYLAGIPQYQLRHVADDRAPMLPAWWLEWLIDRVPEEASASH